jgi:hypothetical protein
MTNQGQSISDDQRKLLTDLGKLSRELGLNEENVRKIRKEILTLTIQNIDALKREVDQLYGIQEIEADRLDAINEIVGLEKEMIKPLTKIATLTDKSYELEKKKLQQLKEQVPEMEDAVNNLLKQLETVNKISKNPIAKIGFSAAASSLDSMQKSLDDFMKSVPGGEMLSDALGLDTLSEKMQNAILSGGKLGMLGVVAAVGILYKVLSDVTKEAEEFSKETGVTFGQARQIADAARDAQTSYGNQLALQKDILDVQQETIKAFGTTAMLTGQQAANVADLGKSFGYGAQQAAQVNNAFMTMGASAGDAYEAQQSLAAEALKAGVNVGAVTKDISENASATSKYFGGNVTALKNAAIEAAKMGMSLSTMSKVADKLLDIESSLSAQFEFQALSGRQIDLDMARQLALQGDIAGASKEVLSAVGSAAEFNQLSVLEKKKLAEATGMEVDELQKSLVIQEKLGDLTDDQKAAMSGLNLSAAELNNLSAEQIKQKLADQQALQKNEAAFESIKNQLMAALIPLAEIVGTVLSVLTPAFKTIGFIIQAAFWPITTAIQGFKEIYNLLTGGGEKLSFWGTTMATLAVTLGVIKGYQIIIANQAALAAGYAQLKAFWENNTVKSMIAQGAQALKNVGLAIAEAVAKVTGMSAATLGVAAGIALTAGAAAYAFLSPKSTGDLAMGANNGPIVANPREGTIFQGTSNDEVAMGPGVIGMAQQSGTGTQTVVNNGGSTDMTETNNLLRQLLGKQSVAVINWGDRDTTQVANAVAADRTTRATYNGR